MYSIIEVYKKYTSFLFYAKILHKKKKAVSYGTSRVGNTASFLDMIAHIIALKL
jgi:hypothetical protein